MIEYIAGQQDDPEEDEKIPNQYAIESESDDSSLKTNRSKYNAKFKDMDEHCVVTSEDMKQNKISVDKKKLFGNLRPVKKHISKIKYMDDGIRRLQHNNNIIIKVLYEKLPEWNELEKYDVDKTLMSISNIPDNRRQSSDKRVENGMKLIKTYRLANSNLSILQRTIRKAKRNPIPSGRIEKLWENAETSHNNFVKQIQNTLKTVNSTLLKDKKVHKDLSKETNWKRVMQLRHDWEDQIENIKSDQNGEITPTILVNDYVDRLIQSDMSPDEVKKAKQWPRRTDIIKVMNPDTFEYHVKRLYKKRREKEVASQEIMLKEYFTNDDILGIQTNFNKCNTHNEVDVVQKDEMSSVQTLYNKKIWTKVKQTITNIAQTRHQEIEVEETMKNRQQSQKDQIEYYMIEYMNPQKEILMDAEEVNNLLERIRNMNTDSLSKDEHEDLDDFMREVLTPAVNICRIQQDDTEKQILRDPIEWLLEENNLGDVFNNLNNLSKHNIKIKVNQRTQKLLAAIPELYWPMKDLIQVYETINIDDPSELTDRFNENPDKENSEDVENLLGTWDKINKVFIKYEYDKDNFVKTTNNQIHILNLSFREKTNPQHTNTLGMLSSTMPTNMMNKIESSETSSVYETPRRTTRTVYTTPEKITSSGETSLHTSAQTSRRPSVEASPRPITSPNPKLVKNTPSGLWGWGTNV